MSTNARSVEALLNRVLVIINPMAGRGRAAQAWPQVAAALVKAGILYDDIRTRRPHDATTLAEHAVDDYDVVIAVGGDGTAHEVANGLLAAAKGGPTLPMAVIPLGHSNDFARMLLPDAQPGHTSSQRGEHFRFSHVRCPTGAKFEMGLIADCCPVSAPL